MKLRLSAVLIHTTGREEEVAQEEVPVVVGRDVTSFRLEAQQVLHVTGNVLMAPRKRAVRAV